MVVQTLAFGQAEGNLVVGEPMRQRFVGLAHVHRVGHHAHALEGKVLLVARPYFDLRPRGKSGEVGKRETQI